MVIPVTTTDRPVRRAARPLPAALTLVAALAAAAVADTAIALLALALGADARMGALSPAVLVPFTVLGMLVACGGWLLVRRLVRDPRRVLRVLVPALLVLSWIPDVAVGVSGGMPGVTVIGVVALMTMHVVAAACSVAAMQRIAPV
jgi:hypothetical protein